MPVDQGAPAPAGGSGPDRVGLDHSGRAIGLGALLLGLVVAGALTGVDGERRREASFAPPAAAVRPGPGARDEAATPTATPAPPTTPSPTGGGQIAPAPIDARHPHALAGDPVWTGQDALFWIGRFDGSADGVWLYRPG